MNRLGMNGPEDVKMHPWFKGFNWSKLISKEMEAPYIPSVNTICQFLQRSKIWEGLVNEDQFDLIRLLASWSVD